MTTLRLTTTADSAVARVAEADGLDPMFVRAIIAIESQGNERATGGAGEVGLMQLWPAGAIRAYERQYGKRPLADYYDPTLNVNVGCWFLLQCIADVRNAGLPVTYRNIAIAYNGGAGALRNPKSSTIAYANAVTNALDWVRARYGQVASSGTASPGDASSGSKWMWLAVAVAVGLGMMACRAVEAQSVVCCADTSPSSVNAVVVTSSVATTALVAVLTWIARNVVRDVREVRDKVTILWDRSERAEYTQGEQVGRYEPPSRRQAPPVTG